MRENGTIRGSTEIEKQFVDHFKQLCQRHNAWQVWQDFIEMSACSIANAVDKRPDIWKQREDGYLEIVKRYSKEELELICDMFSMTVLALEENPAQDFLGKYYMQLDFGSNWHGQFFTPWHIAELMARLDIDDVEKQLKTEDYISVCDTCCGAGCMLLAFAIVCKEDAEVNYQQSVIFVGQDIDPVVAKMCYVQISLLGCPGYVVVGNSLTNRIGGHILAPVYDKPENIWFTPLYFTDIWNLRRFRLMWDKITLLVEDKPEKENTSNSTSNISKPRPKVPTERKPYQKVIKSPVMKEKTSFSWRDFLLGKERGKRK